jgi:DNA-binding GntR family transcriptional regulator
MGPANEGREKVDRTGSGSFLPALEYQHINERTYELLLARIVSQEFAPGQRLQVDEIATALGVSRTPVNYALTRLALEGLVLVQPRKGTFVADVTAEGIEDLFDVRLMIELHAAELAVTRATDSDIAEMEELVTSLEGFVDGDHYNDYETFLDLDSEFHVRILRMAGNALLLKLYRDINLHVQVVRAYQKAPGAATGASESHAEHAAIVAALKARDLGSLRQAVTVHIQNREKQFTLALTGLSEG